MKKIKQKIRTMKKIILILTLILLCSCKKYTRTDILVKNNSDISIYVTAVPESIAGYKKPFSIQSYDKVIIEPFKTQTKSSLGPFYTEADLVCIHFFNAVEYDRIKGNHDLNYDLENIYTDERFYLGSQIYSFGELKGLNNTIEYPSKESPKVGFGSRL